MVIQVSIDTSNIKKVIDVWVSQVGIRWVMWVIDLTFKEVRVIQVSIRYIITLKDIWVVDIVDTYNTRKVIDIWVIQVNIL